MRAYLRFAVVTVILGATALLLQARNRIEILPPHQNLSSFPDQLEEWKGTDLAIDTAVRQILGPGEFLLRDYQDQAKAEPDIGLFIAYFPSQRTGDTIHSPKHCLPGEGWSPIESSEVILNVPGHAPFPANRYVIGKGPARMLVLYWFWAHDRGVANEYWAKFYLIADSVRMNRSDGALVRIMTPILANEQSEAADSRLHVFGEDVTERLNRYVPR